MIRATFAAILLILSFGNGAANAQPVADLILRSTGEGATRADEGLATVVADLFKDRGATRAVLVVEDGRVTAERYAEGYGPDTVFPGYSITKSLTSTMVGILNRAGKLDIHARADVPEWRGRGDPRRAIRLIDLLQMSSGIDSNEDVADLNSDTMAMLFGSGRHDVAHHAADHPLKYQPGSYFTYSNSTTNVMSGIVGRTIGRGEPGVREFLSKELFGPLNIRSAALGFDDAGTLVGSTYSAMTTRDFARFGLMYARGGLSPGGRILTEEWVRFVSTPGAASAGGYGGQFWIGPWSTDPGVVARWPADAFSMRGFQGQIVMISPKRKLVIVILGNTALIKGIDGRAYRDEQAAKILDTLHQ
jgi:CubicO group peptidase (beta-lactamase class C family)